MDARPTFFLWKTFPCWMSSADGARLRLVLAEAVRRRRGFRKLVWTDPAVSNTHELQQTSRPFSHLSALGADGQRLSERGALALLPGRGQVDF